jgi:periplasmic protein TonB
MGSGMIRRRLEALPEDAGAIDLGNVIPFARLRDGAPPLSGIGAAERPAPDFFAVGRWSPWWASVLAGSVLAHAGLAALFLSAQDPVPAVGLEAISVEIVFGADAPAGVAPTPAEQEAQPQPPAPDEPVAESEPPKPEPVLEPAPAVAPPDPEALPRQETKEPERKKEQVAPPSQAASGVGRGQSRSDANYNGRVAAHLARHKRFPEGAQSKRNQGTAVVSFSLDGGGRVVTVKLVRSSGVAALDQEAQAMVRRASPFPAPPSGGTMEFTVPLSFQIR